MSECAIAQHAPRATKERKERDSELAPTAPCPLTHSLTHSVSEGGWEGASNDDAGVSVELSRVSADRASCLVSEMDGWMMDG